MKRKVLHTEKDRLAAIRLIGEGISQAAIARMYGVDRATITRSKQTFMRSSHGGSDAGLRTSAQG